MDKKIIYATVIYKCDDLEIFMHDYLKSMSEQTEKNFELLILTDGVSIDYIRYAISLHSLSNIVHIKEPLKGRLPIQLRKELIDISYEMKADILIFSDFDDNAANNRVEEVNKKIGNYDFLFNDFFIVDNKLRKLEKNSFFKIRDIPYEINDWHDIKSFNYIGFGSLAINLRTYNYLAIEFPNSIKALDWFISTKVLLDGGKGFRLINTYVNYRQHNNSFVGFDFALNEKKLAQGLDVKQSHYGYFKQYNDEFDILYDEILKLRKYIDKIGKENYINIINSKFKENNFCWWENIKIIKEFGNDIKRIE